MKIIVFFDSCFPDPYSAGVDRFGTDELCTAVSKFLRTLLFLLPGGSIMAAVCGYSEASIVAVRVGEC